MTLQTLTTDVRAQSGKLASLGHSMKFEIAGMGCIWTDARKNPPDVSNDDLPADCTISMSETAVRRVLVERSMSPVLAVHSGEIVVEGSRAAAERFLALMTKNGERGD